MLRYLREAGTFCDGLLTADVCGLCAGAELLGGRHDARPRGDYCAAAAIAGIRAAGKVTVQRSPPFSRLHKNTVPPARSMLLRTIGNPRPVPSVPSAAEPR